MQDAVPPGLSDAKYAATSFICAAERWAAIRLMIGFFRLPSRKACSWAARYASFCPARFG
jgi:hypothetical protein